MTVIPRTIDGVFTAAARRAGAATHLLLADGRRVTYAETLERARRLASVLAGAGIGGGDRVAMFMRNSRELFETYIACGLVGAIAVPANGLNTARENGLLFADCTPAALVAETAGLDRVPAETLPGSLALRLVTLGKASGWRPYDEAIETTGERALPEPSRAEAPALIIYSSGTTGNPKGVVDDARLTSGVVGYRDSDRFLTLLPTYSSFGFAFDFLQAGLVGASTVITPAFDAAAAVELIERHRVTCLAGVPTMFVRMAPYMTGRDLSCLRLIDVGGGPVPEKLKADLRHALGVETVESYGLTEISPVATQRSRVVPSLCSRMANGSSVPRGAAVLAK